METIVYTINGSYIVPANKYDLLIQWLEANAVRPGQNKIEEIKQHNSDSGCCQLLNE